jgi:magnesium chelatase family protein
MSLHARIRQFVKQFEVDPPEPPKPEYQPDFSEVRGQRATKRALEIAVAGGHNIIMIGSPGCGKSMLAKRIPSILPRHPNAPPIPFQAPHHTASYSSIIGGGSGHPQPGLITKANGGVLFMDELPEYNRTVLEALREPLEEGTITISRTGGTQKFPAHFMLIAAMNPCPCGYYPDCNCKPEAVRKYKARISGPLLDRIDMHIAVQPVDFDTLEGPAGESSRAIQQRVNAARWAQFYRQQRTLNAELAPGQAEIACQLGPSERATLREGLSGRRSSARAFERVLRVARTIADLWGQEKVSGIALSEALGYRMLDERVSSAPATRVIPTETQAYRKAYSTYIPI